MKRNAMIYLALFLIMTASGIFGSCFLLVVSGVLMLFRSVFLFGSIKNWQKHARIAVSVFFGLFSAYFVYYGFLMLLNTISYAAYRPEVWLMLPVAVSFLVLIFMISDAAENHKEEPTETTAGTLSLSVEDMTVFAVVFTGYLGTFVLDFYFEYAAAICTVLCLLKSIYSFIKNKPEAKTPVNTENDAT